MNNDYRYKFLLIDDAHLLEVHDLKRKVNPAVKHPEPVLKLDAPWDTEKMEHFNYNNVLYDKEEKLFKMWYVVCGQNPNEYWEGARKTAYATSKDGLRWEKPIMNRVEVRGSKENNYIIPEMLSLSYTIIEDPGDPPSRRYKMIFQTESKESRWTRSHMPLNLAYSADGIHWERPVHVNPVMRGISDGGWGFIYDPDRRMYRLYTRRVPNLPRDISLYESYDLVNWEDKGRVLVPGDAYDPPEMFNFQGMTPFFYEDFCLSLLSTQYSLPTSETYEVFHAPPANWPAKSLGHVDVQLAFSRDGVQWSRPTDRTPIIPNGDPGSPDEGVIFIPSANPPVLNGETYIYYTAGRFQHNERTQTAYMKANNYDMRNAMSCMLAKMPEDHWVSLDAGAEEGWLLTKPWHYPGTRMLVNADAQGGSIEAELLTPYGEPVEGFTRKDCLLITGNGKDQEIRWKGMVGWDEAKFLEFATKKYRGGLLAKFYLKNAKFYSYTVAEPDPDGSIGRYWANFRWCEHIKHRSDNWDGKSHEPAKGVPPYRGRAARDQ